MGDTQKYNKALEGVKELYEILLNKNIITKDGEIGSKFIQIFPELEDNNEKIRKEIISTLKYANHKGVYDKHIAWLENQSEKKEKIFNADDWCVSKVDGQIHKVSYYEHESNNEAQLKFEIGNWIIYDRHIRKIKDLDSVCYFVEDIDGNTGTPSISYINDHYKLWNIQDAKPGDILCTSGFVFQFKEIRNDGGVSYYCANEKELHEGDDSTFHVAAKQSLMGYANTGLTHYEPATKEQRDLLFKKMKEAGYEWDAEKKELKKIEQSIDIPFGAKDSELQEVSYYIPEGFHAEIYGNKVVIKKGEQKPAWSEEDEKMYLSIMSVLLSTIGTDKTGLTVTREMNWLKSLKDKYTWKPSDDEMEALAWALSLAKNCGEECAFDLGTLQDQLKKLREE